MAFVKKTDEEIDAEAGSPTTGPSAEGGVIAGSGQGGAPAAASAAQGSATQAKPGTTGSGMFDNVGRYLDVNADKATGLANRVTGVLGSDINKATSAVDNAKDLFNKDVDKSTVKFNQGLVTDATKNAEAYAADQAKKAAVQGQYNASYAGPMGLGDQDYYNSAQSAVGNAKSAAELAKTEAGRKELLARAGKGRSSGGVLSLNNAILQNSADAQNLIANSAKGASTLDQRLADAAAAAGVYAKQGESTTNATRDSTRKAFGDVYGAFQTDAKGKATTAQKGAETAASGALGAFNTGATLTPAQLSLLGIAQPAADSFRSDLANYQTAVNEAKLRDPGFAADPNQFSDLSKLTDDRGAYGTVNPGAGLFSASNTASAQDYARLQALNQLSGRGDAFLTDPSLAGTAPGDLLDFRFSDLQKRLSDALAAANDANAKGREQEVKDKEKQKEEEKDKVETEGKTEEGIDTLVEEDPPIQTGNPTLDSILNGAAGGVKGVSEAASDGGKNTVNTLHKALLDTKAELGRLASNTKKAAGKAAEKTKGFIAKPGDTTAKAVKTAGKDVANTTKKATADVKKTVSTAAKDTGKEAAKILAGAAAAAQNPAAAASGAWDNIVSSLDPSASNDRWKNYTGPGLAGSGSTSSKSGKKQRN